MRRYLEFIKEVEGLKSTLRTAWTATGRQESTAEHSWRLALGAAVLCCEFPELDREKVMLMCLVHDLGELYTGDVSAALRPDEGEKHRQEQPDVSRATKAISGPCAKEIMALCEEYNQGQTPEARFVKAMDKAETIIQHSQGANPPDFDYEFNLSYGMEYFQENEKLKELRTLMDEETSEAQHRSLQ